MQLVSHRLYPLPSHEPCIYLLTTFHSCYPGERNEAISLTKKCITRAAETRRHSLSMTDMHFMSMALPACGILFLSLNHIQATFRPHRALHFPEHSC